MAELEQFDGYLKDDGPAALVIREYLMPVEGRDGVVFPATFAAGDGFRGGYNVDASANGTNVCLIDSVGAQANRIEPIFMQEQYKPFVPQIVVKAGEKDVNLLEVGHRAGDALVRCSALQQTLRDAFHASQKGDAEPLAKIAPTSLVFGVWDSRDTQEKRPRLVSSTIRAFNVRELKRGAVYIPPVDYASLDVFSEEDKSKAEGDKKNPLAKRGFVHNPASASHGGVIADGGVRRDAILALAALRLLHAGQDRDKTLALRRYVLGLALVAFTYRPGGYLRQGCLLVLDPEKAEENDFVEVYSSGKRSPATISHDAALTYAEIVASKFGVGADRTEHFEKKLAKDDVKPEGDGKKGKKAKDKKAEPLSDTEGGA
ncbi:MAG: type I-G CRISPR-associated RAMP protein Csb1/Cas7g [Pirellulales bacterium]